MQQTVLKFYCSHEQVTTLTGRRGAEENEAHCRQAKPGITSSKMPGFAVCGRIALSSALSDPFCNRLLKSRAFVRSLHLLKSRLRQVRHIWKPPLPDTRISDDVNRLAKLPSGAVFAPGVGEPLHEEYRIRREDGEFFYWTDSPRALRDGNGATHKWERRYPQTVNLIVNNSGRAQFTTLLLSGRGRSVSDFAPRRGRYRLFIAGRDCARPLTSTESDRSGGPSDPSDRPWVNRPRSACD